MTIHALVVGDSALIRKLLSQSW